MVMYLARIHAHKQTQQNLETEEKEEDMAIEKININPRRRPTKESMEEIANKEKALGAQVTIESTLGIGKEQ
jgi:hypothetical protein